MGKCKDCKWLDDSLFEKEGIPIDEGIGLCRCHSPVFVLGMIEVQNNDNWEWPANHDACWPVVCADDWCGEFKPKVKTE